MLRTCQHHFPSLLRYLYTCYDSVGYLFLLDSGEVVGSYACGERVWQGDPLGNPCFSMAIYTFMEKLKALCWPEAALRKTSDGVPYAWIVDDCTLVPSGRRVLEIVRFIIEQGPAHGLYPNMSKFHAWFTRSDRGSMDVADELQRLGCQYLLMGSIGCLGLQSALALSASALVAIWTRSLLRLRISFLLYLQLHTPRHSIICYSGVHRIFAPLPPSTAATHRTSLCYTTLVARSKHR
jgi:hypothetical protein